MYSRVILALTILALGSAQVPNFGFCPEYVAMVNFDMMKFLGVWFEAERYFQLSEVISRCVMTNYSLGADNKLRVSNEVMNRFTGIKRVIEGEIKPSPSKAEEGNLHVKYTTIPLTPETKYSVLETDYKTYAVMWSCSGIGPIHTQNAWIMTRERLPTGEVLQKAYAVLDKYKISKTFFVKTDQADCAIITPQILNKPQNDDSSVVEENTDERSIPTEHSSTPLPTTINKIIMDETKPEIMKSEEKKPMTSSEEVLLVPQRILKRAVSELHWA